MSKRKTVYMGTTEISADRSAAGIASLLVQAGAQQIATDYKDGRIAGLRFTLVVAGKTLIFDLPARTEPVTLLLLKQKPWTSARTRLNQTEYEKRIRADAERIGWRQLYRWTEAQLAMIEAGMVSAHEVFYPYLFDGRRTLVQAFEQDTLKLLPAAKPQ